MDQCDYCNDNNEPCGKHFNLQLVNIIDEIICLMII